MKIGEIIIDSHAVEGFVNIDPDFWSDPTISTLARADLLKDTSGLVNQEYERALEEWEEESKEVVRIMKAEKEKKDT